MVGSLAAQELRDMWDSVAAEFNNLLQAAALRRRRALQRQVLYTKPVTAQAGEAIQVIHASPCLSCKASKFIVSRLTSFAKLIGACAVHVKAQATVQLASCL